MEPFQKKFFLSFIFPESFGTNELNLHLISMCTKNCCHSWSAVFMLWANFVLKPWWKSPFALGNFPLTDSSCEPGSDFVVEAKFYYLQNKTPAYKQKLCFVVTKIYWIYLLFLFLKQLLQCTLKIFVPCCLLLMRLLNELDRNFLFWGGLVWAQQAYVSTVGGAASS